MDLSVVIPAFNPGVVDLMRCVRSVAAISTLELEVIVVDDGSTNMPESAWRDVLSADGRICVIHQANGGVSAARNAGMSRATGTYVTFVDADDMVVPGWYETAYAKGVEADADIVYGRVLSCLPTEVSVASQGHLRELTWRTLPRDARNRIMRELLLDESDWIEGLHHLDHGPCAKLFRRTCLSDVTFPVGMTHSEDNVFNHLALQHAGTCLVTNDLAYLYLKNERSVTHQAKSGTIASFVRSLEMIESLLPSNDPSVSAAFAVRALFDLWMGFGIETYFDGAKPLTGMEKIARWRSVRQTPVLVRAVRGHIIYMGPGWKSRLKFFLIRNLGTMMVVLKSLRRRK